MNQNLMNPVIAARLAQEREIEMRSEMRARSASNRPDEDTTTRATRVQKLRSSAVIAWLLALTAR